MKILYVATVSGTINAFLIPHIKMILDAGHTVDVACSITSPISYKIYDYGCNVHEINFCRSPLSRKNIQAYKDLKKLIINGQYDLVHTHTPVASTCVRIGCRKMKNVKIVYTAHGFHFYKGSLLKNWLIYYPIEKWLSRYTDCLITINEEDYNIAIQKNFKANEIKKVHGVGVDLNKLEFQNTEEKLKIRKEYGYLEEDFILFYAAELNYNKHQDLLINSISILREKIPNIKLLLAGSGIMESQYKAQAEKLAIHNNIEFLGHRKDVPKLLKLSDIVVASSRREGLPVNVMEAMVTGLPLVVTNVRGHRDLVKDGENGYIIELDDVEDFANSIEKLYRDDKLRIEFGKRGIKLVQKYSLENVLKEMQGIYKL
ncbi:glycosyltransferase family 4 protein [Tissierella praeacuta]|uniref:glycosyltransferase family 4 protein n=1 Tax=Tissierella praeacuta TaxID=43131 RepID=UPI00333EA9A5